MIRIYTIWRELSMGDTMGCGVVSSRLYRHFSRHGKWGPQEGREPGLVYTIQKAPAHNGTPRRGTTSDERKGRPCWRLHCPAWWSNSQENMQINYLLRLTRKLRLDSSTPPQCDRSPSSGFLLSSARLTVLLPHQFVGDRLVPGELLFSPASGHVTRLHA
jgi:hypothetical protein